MSKYKPMTAEDARLIARFMGVRWSEVAETATGSEQARLRELRFNNVLAQLGRNKEPRVTLRDKHETAWRLALDL
jgi:hypothetical protein